MENKISREDLLKIYNVELNFFDSLVSSGLISTYTENSTSYLFYDELPAFERFANWHYDLDVNMAGLEIINSLLEKIKELQGENKKLEHLKFLKENGLWEEADYLEEKG